MDLKAPTSSLCLFKETRTDLEPSCTGSVIQIQVPSSSTFSVRPRQQRRVLRSSPAYTNEDSFNKHCLASSSSFFFGKSKRHPRSFIWRVLQESRVLELCCVDLSKRNREEREASLTIQLLFPNAIRHGGVALAGTEDQDAISVIALTHVNELYTFTLRKDFFCHVTASEEDISRWCKTSKPATFSISTPHNLIAASSLQLVVSLSDGRLLQLTRRKGEDGSKWHETTYGDGQWTSSLRGLVRWQGSNTVKYDGATLEQGTPVAMALSPDKKHIFAVCLNHTLRIWSLNKATSVFSKDLLWQHREPHDIPKVMLDPANSNVLQVFEAGGSMEGDLYYAATFSPHDFGHFTFWGIRDPDHGDRGVRDLFSEYYLKPPDPDPSPESKAIWKVASFKIKGGHRGQQSEMWVLMRSNRHHKLYSLKFQIEGLPDLWQTNWTMVASETLDESPVPHLSDVDPDDAMDKWPRFLLTPGHYPKHVLETALAMYCSERSVSPPKTKASLKERMCSAITLRVNDMNYGNDFNKYREAIDEEWTVLWQEIRDLNRSRWEILALAYDDHTEMPYIAFADGVSAIRTCDKVEIIAQNSSAALGKSVGMLERPSIEVDQGKEPKLPDEIAVIVEAATMFRQSFSYGLRQSCGSILAEELWLQPSYSVPLRIQSFYDGCNFAAEISISQIEKLAKTLKHIGGYDGLDTDTFFALLDDMSHSMPQEDSGLVHTIFGRGVLVNGAREMIALRERLLLDLLCLVVFVDMETDRKDWPMLSFDANTIYEALLERLKQYQIMHWLAKNTRTESSKDVSGPATTKATNADTASSDQNKISIVLEDLFALPLPAQPHDTQSQSEALTYTVQDLLQWTLGGDASISLDDVQVYVQCNLLANNNIDLASDFLRYQPSTEWATYIKGRLCLIKGEFTEAAIYFKKAAFKLSRPSDFDYTGASHGLLSLMDALSFGNGLPTYYTHILNLFDAASCPTQMAHFAHLALQLNPPSEKPSEQSLTLLTSLFQASLQTTDFATAYSALSRHPSPSTLLPSFISSLLTTPNALPQLLAFPFPPNLLSEIDTILSSQSTSPKILAAWRIRHNNFRGAAAALLPSLQAAQARVKRDADGSEEGYLTVINLLACAGKENNWVLSEGSAPAPGHAGGKGKRKVVTISDVRDAYQKELDRQSMIEGERFGFGGGGIGLGDEMDVS